MATSFIEGGRPLKSRIEWLLENPTMSDLKFIVGEENEEFPGHKFMFAVSSHDFYNGFYAMTPEDNIIRLPEIPVAAFKEFLSYIYTEEANIISDNILDIMRLAARYEIKHLMIFCYQSAEKFIDEEMQLVGSLLKIGISYKDQSPIFVFLAVISKDPIKYLKAAEVGYLTRDHLKFILEDVDTKASEGELFKLSVMWAEKISSSTDPVKIRTVLGDLIQLIRFPTMSLQQFEQCVAENEEILESKDVVDIILFIGNNNTNRVCKYPVVKRKEVETVVGSEMLTKEEDFNQAKCRSNHVSYFNFSVKENCLLEGFKYYINGKISSEFPIYFELSFSGPYCVGIQPIATVTYNHTGLSNKSSNLVGKSIELCTYILHRKILLETTDSYKIKLECKTRAGEYNCNNTLLNLPKYSNEIVILSKLTQDINENRASPIAALTVKRV